MNKKFDFIDAIRGLAIIGVVAVHASNYGIFKASEMTTRIINHGARGVQLFFLASAFTLFYSFENRINKEKSYIKNFFIRRFFRIAPLYYIGIIYYLIQDGLGPKETLGDSTGISLLNILSNFSFSHGINPYWINSVVPGGWSIAVEMTFYLFLPFIFFKIQNLNKAITFFFSSLVLRKVLAMYLVKHNLISDERLWDEFLFFYFPSQLPIFMLGLILYFIILKEEKPEISPINLILFSGLILIQALTEIYFLFPTHIIFGFSFFFLFWGLSKYPIKIIVNPIINYIGRVSFSIYIVHFAVFHLMEKYTFVDFIEVNSGLTNIINYGIRFLIGISISIGISTILNKVIENPMQNLGKKIIEKIELKK